MRHEIYHPGGFRSDLPNGNRAELWDSGTGLFQRWDESGNTIEQRPLSNAESEALSDPPAPPATADDRIAGAQAVLADGAAELAQLPAPTTPADLTATVADILARAAAALNGGA